MMLSKPESEIDPAKVRRIERRLCDASDYLVMMRHDGKSMMLHKAVQLVVDALADLHAMERKHYPATKICGLDFPTSAGAHFDRIIE